MSAAIPPRELLDPEGEGIYLLDLSWSGLPDEFGWPVLEAARRLELFDDDGRLDWRAVDMQVCYMQLSDDGETWVPANIGRWPRGWRLNLPRRWVPACYIYCTPRP